MTVSSLDLSARSCTTGCGLSTLHQLEKKKNLHCLAKGTDECNHFTPALGPVGLVESMTSPIIFRKGIVKPGAEFGAILFDVFEHAIASKTRG